MCSVISGSSSSSSEQQNGEISGLAIATFISNAGRVIELKARLRG